MSAGLDSPHLKVLLVEDNPDDAALLERHLRRNGFLPDMTRVETASAMQASLNTSLPDIVLGDYNLPNFSGPEALRLLKISGLDIPFIMLSGAVSEQTAVDSMRAGAQDYVSKQNLTRLVPAVERELKEASGRRNKLAAEVALRASEARFHHLVDAMPMGLLLNDGKGRISYANQAIARLLGRSVEDLTSGNVVVDSVCADILPAQMACTVDGISNAAPFESVCQTENGTTIDALIGVTLLNPEASSETWQFAAFVADLSLQKKSQEALRQTEKLAVAGRFAASIAHEINNPLEAITNCLYLVMQTDLPDDARGYVDLAQQELDRVSQITVQTLRFFRGSTRQGATDLRELIDTVVTLLESRLQRAQIEVVREFRTQASVVAQGGEIRQVVANLVGNAMDAMTKGGRLILRTADGVNRTTGERGVVLTVADGGSGMDQFTLDRIFEPFFSTKGITGTGLGLWISQEIVAKHSGTMRVRSKPGAGTVFRLFLPALGVVAGSESKPRTEIR
ncbi:hybrid sensor histidine kinase/response regulator [Terriglobus saanensis]|uniref:histidine kinase n=1 Tax=Terriglobus saanensis (strain ATCC BAA-1853 / DSM 23119 / SP1PR4) TaxID=401053 RepID=E8V1E4_TERSS|nr:hybrid sensor histidine kinase/response regulator [Terriglobus saanensis]ADV81139.1 multi-sensor signal transduction histidine kinase [Terriglobus saanensis SP1PR4]